jgi:hypothetical protein
MLHAAEHLLRTGPLGVIGCRSQCGIAHLNLPYPRSTTTAVAVPLATIRPRALISSAAVPEAALRMKPLTPAVPVAPTIVVPRVNVAAKAPAWDQGSIEFLQAEIAEYSAEGDIRFPGGRLTVEGQPAPERAASRTPARAYEA